jgi:hypothetical protein
MKLDFITIGWNLACVVVTVIIHSFGTVLIISERSRLFSFATHGRKLLRGQFAITVIVIELLTLHLAEIAFWGLCVRALGLFVNFEDSIFFAGVSYTSLGFNGTILRPTEGFSEVLISMMGLLMFGWSVGILVTTVIRYEKVSVGWDPANDAPISPDLG